MSEDTLQEVDTSYRAYLDYCTELEDSTPAYREVEYLSYDDWRAAQEADEDDGL